MLSKLDYKKKLQKLDFMLYERTAELRLNPEFIAAINEAIEVSFDVQIEAMQIRASIDFNQLNLEFGQRLGVLESILPEDLSEEGKKALEIITNCEAFRKALKERRDKLTALYYERFVKTIQ